MRLLLLTFFTMFLALSSFIPNELQAARKCAYTGGCGYERCKFCPGIGPGVVITLAGVGYMIASSIQQSSEQHSN